MAGSLDQFEDDVTTFSLLDGRVAAGESVAVLSNAGFEATAAADTLNGMRLADLAGRRARGSPPSCHRGSWTSTTRWTRRR